MVSHSFSNHLRLLGVVMGAFTKLQFMVYFSDFKLSYSCDKYAIYCQVPLYSVFFFITALHDWGFLLLKKIIKGLKEIQID